MTTFSTGAIVHARGREWVVQPGSKHPVYKLQPLGGTTDEQTSVHAAIEDIASATFAAPDPKFRGDANSCRLLRDAARLATRHSAGPYRCFGSLGFEPRPYQLVPMIMALKLDPIRLLIADDVGIGKTIEALMIARELYDRHEIKGFSVLSPPHLAPQWAKEMREKFHLDAELVLSSTAQSLERRLRSATETIFERFPITVVSLDYVKNPRRCREFLQTCPSLVIIDEAHTCTVGNGIGRSAHRQQRYELLKGLADKTNQHMILTTATPHSGNTDAYDSLLGLLDNRFAAGGELEPGNIAIQTDRDRELAKRFVQRRRPDIKDFLGDTKFPVRMELNSEYSLGSEMKALINETVAFTKKYVSAPGKQHVQRTRHWAMLTLLQAIASSPAAAAATLVKRSGKADDDLTDPDLFADILEKQLVDDFMDETDIVESAPSIAMIEGGLEAGDATNDSITSQAQRFFSGLRKKAEAISVENDAKFLELERFVKKHISEKGGTVVFCRFIATAEYITNELRKSLGKKAVVECVIGSLPDSERTSRINGLVEEAEKTDVARVLVCTDCLSEGINLQEHFDTVVHYDLSWNPNRHVQREGRVDRFGQPRDSIQVCFFHSNDTVFDKVVRERLHSKRNIIASELGYLVSIPLSRETILAEIIEEADRRILDRSGYLFSEAELDQAKIRRDEDEKECLAIIVNEKKIRLRFNQHAISPLEVDAELKKIREAIGGTDSVERFVIDVLRRAGCVLEPLTKKCFRLNLSSEVQPAIREAINTTLSPNRTRGEHTLRFDGNFVGRQHKIERAHPLVASIADYVLQSALDPLLSTGGKTQIAARTGLMTTTAVKVRTIIFLLRSRFQLLITHTENQMDDPLLAEEVFAIAVEGDLLNPDSLVVIPAAKSAELIEAVPAGNFDSARAERLLQDAVKSIPFLKPLLAKIVTERASELAKAHDHARAPTKKTTRKAFVATQVLPTGDPDILGVFILMPTAPNGGAA